MDIFLLIPCIIIAIIIIGYLVLTGVLHCYSNPNSIAIGTNEKPSIVTHTYMGTRGDMGNQIFQLATLIGAAKRSNANIVLPSRSKDLPMFKLFDMEFEFKDIEIDGVFYEYDNYELINIPKDGKNYDIRGYRQAYKYFDDYRDDVIKTIKIKQELIDKLKPLLPEKYIAVHIRRGDYIKLIHKIPILREFRRCQLSYYQSAIKKIREIYHNEPLLVCTDSPDWVKTIMKELDPEHSDNIRLAPIHEEISPKFSDFITLYLSQAMVISNSTYSWWAAYLNNENITVCAPTPWWDPDGLIGTGLGLDGPYLHYPSWYLFDTDDGHLVREPYSNKGEKLDLNHETLNIYRLIRGTLL